MGYFAGIDVSLETSHVCVLDETGRIVREGKVDSEPAALAAFLRGTSLAFDRIGLEAGPLSQWLHAGLSAATAGRADRDTARQGGALGDDGQNG